MAKKKGNIKFVVSPDINIKEEKYCWFKKNNVEYVDWKDTEFLKEFLNAQGKILPRRVTGTSQKWQKRVARAVKRARYMGLLPYVTSHLQN